MISSASWERLADALEGSFEDEILDGLLSAYRAMEPRIEQAYKRAAMGAGDFPLRRLLTLRAELGEGLADLKLSPALKARVDQALAAGQTASDLWAMAALQKVAPKGDYDFSAVLSPVMARQNPNALLAAAQRENALINYAAGGKYSQSFAYLNRLVEVDLRGRIMGAVEFHLAQGDSWRQLSKTLKESLELTKNRAQMVARTEMGAAMSKGINLRYEQEGIDYVQFISTKSSATCSYCAWRHGNVYERSEIVIKLHPWCRCTVVPWSPEWEKKGVTDPQADAEQKAAVLAELEKAGKKPNHGPAPFERSLGLKAPPKPFWEPPAVSKTKPGISEKVEQVGKPEKVKPKDYLSMIPKQVAAPSRHTVKGGDVQRLFKELKGRDGLEGKAAEKVLKFMEQENTCVLFTGGRALKTKKQADYIINNKAFREALARDYKRNRETFSGRLHILLEDMDDPKSNFSVWNGKDRVPGGIGELKNAGKVGGHTYDGASFITIGAKKGQDKNFKVADLMDGVAKSLDRAASGKPFHAVTSGVDNMKHHWAPILFHELGHNVYDAQGPIKIDRLIPPGDGVMRFISQRGIKGFKISKYGSQNVDELFAESFCAYALAPSKLREVSPATFKWVEDVLKKVTK